MSENALNEVAPSGVKQAVVGAQMLFVAFGALVLVPLLTGLDPNVALFTAGAGTLIFQTPCCPTPATRKISQRYRT